MTQDKTKAPEKPEMAPEQPVKPEDGSVDTEAMKKALKDAEVKRVEACQREMAETLQKHNCDLAVSMMITAAGNQPMVNIVPKK